MTANNCEIIRVEKKDYIIKRYKKNAKNRYTREKEFYLTYGQRFEKMIPKLYQYDDDTLELFLEKKGMSLVEFNYRKSRKRLHKYNEEILGMVEELKSENIFHNDIRYKNVLIDCKDNLCLIDFEMWSNEDNDKNSDKILPIVPFKYTIFVINAYPERTIKYLNDDRYTIWSALTPDDITDEILSKYHFRYNAKELLKKKICACSESHLSCIRHIRDNQINNAIIIEDDAIIDFERIDELDNINEPCYIGGQIKSLKLCDEKLFVKPDDIPDGLNTIDKNKYRVSGAFGYYIPDYNQTQFFLKQHYEKRRGIDVEFMLEQKTENIKYFIYPAISTLYLPDAKKGFSNSQMNIKNDFKHY